MDLRWLVRCYGDGLEVAVRCYGDGVEVACKVLW